MSICRDAKEFTNQQGRGKFQVARDRLTHLIQSDETLHLCCDVEYLPLKSSTKQEQKIWDLTPERAMAIRDAMDSLYSDKIHTDTEIIVSFLDRLYSFIHCFVSRSLPISIRWCYSDGRKKLEHLIRINRRRQFLSTSSYFD
jgi:hypothetical protein